MMSDDPLGKEKTDDPVRRVLKNLPPVKATPDFEARLQRRLSEPERPREYAWWNFIFPARIPAFGYSLLALAAVGIVSYYMFWRSGIAPMTIRESAPPAGAGADQTPILKQGEAAHADDERKLQPMGTPAAEPGTGFSAQSGSGGRQADRLSAKPQVESDRAAAPARAGSGVEEPPRGGEASGNALKAAAEPRKEAAETQKAAVETQKEAAEIPKDEVSPAEPKAQLQQNVQMQAKKAGPMAPQLQKAQGLPMTSPSVPAAGEYRREIRALSEAAVVDSAAVRDSLRLDSIKRAEQHRRLLLRKAKVKKPGG